MKKPRYIKFGECLSCFQCKKMTHESEVIRTKDKQIICEDCYIPSR